MSADICLGTVGRSAEPPAEDRLAGFFAQDRELPAPFAGRGIVIPGGGGRFSICTWVCATQLRRLGCTLPIQVWYLGPQEVDDFLFARLSELNVEVVDAHQVRENHPHMNLNGWELKPYAIAYSPFEEVLLLDADNCPVVNPERLFELDEYAETGAIFWPDYWRMAESRSYWEVMGIAYRDEPEFESGQVLVNKAKCWEALLLTNWLCERGQSYFFRHCHGDKDCFRAGWRRTDTSFAMPTYGVTSLSDRVMVQYDFRGERVFQHRNLAKWSIGKNPRILDFWYETECMKSAREYRTEYLAQRFELSERDRARTKSLVGAKFWYIRCKHDHRVLELSEEFEIGEGCGGLEQIYFVKDDELYILDYKGSITCRLQQAGGLWVGRWETYERMPIVLEPIE